MEFNENFAKIGMTMNELVGDRLVMRPLTESHTTPPTNIY